MNADTAQFWQVKSTILEKLNFDFTSNAWWVRPCILDQSWQAISENVKSLTLEKSQ